MAAAARRNLRPPRAFHAEGSQNVLGFGRCEVVQGQLYHPTSRRSLRSKEPGTLPPREEDLRSRPARRNGANRRDDALNLGRRLRQVVEHDQGTNRREVASEDPNRLVLLDALRTLEAQGQRGLPRRMQHRSEVLEEIPPRSGRAKTSPHHMDPPDRKSTRLNSNH